jgi:hypothetical protein
MRRGAMAIMLSNSQSSTLEPLRKNRYILQFTSVPGNTGAEEPLAFACISANRPEINLGEKDMKRLHETYYVAGAQVTWNPEEVKFYDFIQGNTSASQIMWNWATSVYNPVTGQMFFKSQYSTSATLAMLDPSGNIVEVWNLYYIFPTKVTWGEVGSEGDDIMTISASFRYDFAIKANSVNTAP